MTYPPQGPQGPYGQQPDPYGQQQPQYGGGYQQQPTGQYGGYDPNAQYGAGYQQYPGMGGPQPPKKNKGPIIAIVAIVVLLLGGLGITGFVAPGFFLSDDKNDSADEGGKGGDGGNGGDDKSGGADAFIEKLVAAADSQNKSELRSAACDSASDNVEGAIKNIDEISSAKLKDTREEGDEVVAVLTIEVDGDSDDYAATVKKDGSSWCWSDFAPGDGTGSSDSGAAEPSASENPSTDSDGGSGGGGGAGEPDPADGEATIDEFLDKMNAGDGAGAAGMACSDSTYGPAIEETAKQNPALEKKPGTLDADSISVSTDLQGTLNGQDAIGTMSAFTEDDGTWCIYTFFAG
jgi:hypothetical protein